MELLTGENDNARRLDRILRKALPNYPLSMIHRLLRQGQVFINGKPAKAQDRPACGMIISIPSLKESAITTTASGSSTTVPEVIWESSGLIAVNKPPGLATHGNNSLESMVCSFLSGKLTPSLSFKPGPLHRLDKPSSGLVVFSTSLEGARGFSSLMRDLKVKKTYLAIIEGTLKNDEIWQDVLVRDKEKKKTFISGTSDGKTAITKVIALAVKNDFSLIQVEITTGRTHQIRSQAAAHGYPLLGDIKYGAKGAKRQIADIYLHAWKLEFSNNLIKAPLPDRFRDKVNELFGVISYK